MSDIIRQGDVLLIPVGELPAGTKTQPDRLGLEVAGEQTGHAHRLVGEVAVSPEGAEFVRGGNSLTHPEHRHVLTERTWYKVIVQREHRPAGDSLRSRVD